MKTEKSSRNKIRFGVVGILGYSRSHIGQIQSAQDAGYPVELSADFAYMREKNEKQVAELEARGVKIVNSYDELLEMKDVLDCITLPVGTPLHMPMGVKALESGFPVYLEKPVAGAIQDADRLVQAEIKAGKKLFIGYQLCFQPIIWQLKRRLLDGDIGRIKRIVVVCYTPRTKSYFNRNSWAGRLAINGTVVLDSPLNNANAHYINLALFLAGKEVDQSGCPCYVDAQLYRANDIESADTVSLKVITEQEVEIVWVSSHACSISKGPRIRIEGSKKIISADYGLPDKTWREIPSGTAVVEDKWGSVNPFVQVAKWLQGDKTIPVCDMKIARAQTLVVNAAHMAADVTKISDRYIKAIVQEDGDILLSITGMDEILDICYEKGCMVSESGLAPWSVPAGRVDARNLTYFILPGSHLKGN